MDDILSSSTHLTPSGGVHAPNLVPFTYRAVERGQRPRSASPRSMDHLPPRPTTVPIPYPRTGRPASRVGQPRPPAQRGPRAAPSETETVRTPPPPPADRLPRREEDITRMQNLPPSQQPPREAFHVGPGPTPQPVCVRRLFNGYPIFKLMRWNLFSKVFHLELLPHRVTSEVANDALVQVGTIPVKHTEIKHIE